MSSKFEMKPRPEGLPTSTAGRPAIWPDRLTPIANNPDTWFEIFGSTRSAIVRAVTAHRPMEERKQWKVSVTGGRLFVKFASS